MYIQKCVKGIVGDTSGSSGLTQSKAQEIIDQDHGIMSNWWRKEHQITPPMIADVLTRQNLDRHLHDYENFGDETPFISLASGSVERNTILQRNFAYSAIDTALQFATDDWTRPGALFFCWVATSNYPAVEVSNVAEAVRDLNIYQRWSPYQLEGELTAKVHIPSNQIERVEWWDPSHGHWGPQHTWSNPKYVEPDVLSNIRELF
ncbi:hypothetical protein [Tropicibacter sp. Alg240-R139]|uniref:hypothetical protein n=1 Tax=Tropicibacter sp. Alg240-R139 TaxID=2305991 RepID=UPI0013DF31DF|nr:hypothetical protein [Tropicibacter sp. Alg240-R139]